MAAPIAFLQLGKFAEQLECRSALDPAHEVADRQLWRDRYEHMHMVTRYNALEDLYAILCANLADDLPHAQLHITAQQLVAILRRPDQMIAMIENAMLSFVVLHDHTLRKNEP